VFDILESCLLSEFEVLGQDAAGKVLCHERFVDLLGVPRDQRVLSVTSQDEDLVRFHALDRITQDVVHICPLDLPLEHGGACISLVRVLACCSAYRPLVMTYSKRSAVFLWLGFAIQLMTAN